MHNKKLDKAILQFKVILQQWAQACPLGKCILDSDTAHAQSESAIWLNQGFTVADNFGQKDMSAVHKSSPKFGTMVVSYDKQTIRKTFKEVHKKVITGQLCQKVHTKVLQHFASTNYK